MRTGAHARLHMRVPTRARAHLRHQMGGCHLAEPLHLDARVAVGVARGVLGDAVVAQPEEGGLGVVVALLDEAPEGNEATGCR